MDKLKSTANELSLLWANSYLDSPFMICTKLAKHIQHDREIMRLSRRSWPCNPEEKGKQDHQLEQC